MSGGAGFPAKPYFSVGFRLADGSGASAEVDVNTGEVRNYRPTLTLLASSISPDLTKLANRAKEMLEKDGVKTALTLFNVQTTGAGPREFVFEDSEAYKYVIHIDSVTGKRVMLPIRPGAVQVQETPCHLGREIASSPSSAAL